MVEEKARVIMKIENEIREESKRRRRKSLPMQLLKQLSPLLLKKPSLLCNFRVRR